MPALDDDDRLLLEPLRRLGADPVAAAWDDPTVDWAAFDLVVIRSTWDYVGRRDEFVAWAHGVPRLVNPADVVAWNTDKRYLGDIAAAGVSVVPTIWLEAPETPLPRRGEHVLKPSVGAGSIGAARFALHDEREATLAREHATRLLSDGKTVMVQPYQRAVEQTGETGLIFVGGTFSHAIRKGPMLPADATADQQGLYMREQIIARQPSPAELRVARQALAVVPRGPARLAYARVDLIPADDGSPLVIELELTEPSLFMSTAPGSPDRFAGTLVRLAAAAAAS